MINRAVRIICCEAVLRGYDILLWNFGNSGSRLKDDPARVYITVKDPSITPREDLQRRWLLLRAWRMRGTQLLIRSHAFPSLGSQSFDCLAVSAWVLWWVCVSFSFAVSKWLAYFLNYVTDSPAPSPLARKWSSWTKRTPVGLYAQQSLLRNLDNDIHFLIVSGYGCARCLCFANSANRASALKGYVPRKQCLDR